MVWHCQDLSLHFWVIHYLCDFRLWGWFLGNILYAVWFRYFLGALVIILGIHQMGFITIKSLQFQKSLTFHNNKNRNGLFNAFILGLTFSFGWTPCVGPVLSSVLALVASGKWCLARWRFDDYLYSWIGHSFPTYLFCVRHCFETV